MRSKGYASFFDTFAEGRYTLGINGETELYHHTGKLDWYVFYGKNGDEILRHYYSVSVIQSLSLFVHAGQ